MHNTDIVVGTYDCIKIFNKSFYLEKKRHNMFMKRKTPYCKYTIFTERIGSNKHKVGIRL